MSNKILFVTGNYLPAKNGGIENYTHWLATCLLERGFQAEVAVLHAQDEESFSYQRVKVNYLKEGLDSFVSLLRNGDYKICHFQEYSSYGGIEVPWFREAKKYVSKVFFTFHLPYLSCYKGDFRNKGIKDCDDFSSSDRCVSCCIATKLHYKRTPMIDLNRFSIQLMTIIIKKSSKGIKLRKNIEARNKELQALIESCDTIFIYGKWFKRVLEKNGFTASSIKEISHISDINLGRNRDTRPGIKAKLIFVGRIEKQKGLYLLCKALRILNLANIELDVYGNIVDSSYYNSCENEFRFNYMGSVPRKELIKTFSKYDFLILPSIFTEMNSLVLREALYEQLPVIVSDAKGNKDVVAEGVNGFLFEYGNAKDLAIAIDKAYTLKREGWQPVFTYPENPEKDIKEIISYYR